MAIAVRFAVGLAPLHVSADPTLPAVDPAGETVLVGPGVRNSPACARSCGRWTVEPDSVVPSGGAARPGWFWLVAGQAARFDNGTVRARFEGHGPIEATLLLRARAARRSRRLTDAYGLRICGRWAWLIRVRAGTVHLVEHKVLLKPGRRRSIEVIFSALGPHLVANIYDAATSEHLAILSTHEASGLTGSVGLMAGCNRGKKAAALTLLTTRRACERVPASVPGAQVVVWVPASEDGRVAGVSDRAVELETTRDDLPVTSWRCDPAGLELLFCDGRTLLQAATDLPWKYHDLALLRHLGRGPVASGTGFRIDMSYKDPQMVEDLLRGWHERYPDRTRLEQIGTSLQGRPVLALAVGNDLQRAADRPAVLLDGGIHGDEIMATEFVLDAIQVLLESTDEPRVKRWLNELVTWCVPLVNPDGLHAFVNLSVRAGRKNGRDVDRDGQRGILDGVDLNRNYPFQFGQLHKGSKPDSRYYRGAGPASEPETEAMIRLADREHFVASVSYHMGTLTILAPYTIDGVENPEPNEAWLIAEHVASKLSPHPQGGSFSVRRNLYSVDGVDQDWHRHAHGTVALLVEGGKWPPPLDRDMRTAVVTAVRPTWTALLDRFLDGPSVSGRVITADGRPARVEVRILEQTTKAGEIWTTRPRDGRFDRYLPAPGRYRLALYKGGELLLQRSLDVGRERVRIDFVLEAMPAKSQ